MQNCSICAKESRFEILISNYDLGKVQRATFAVRTIPPDQEKENKVIEAVMMHKTFKSVTSCMENLSRVSFFLIKTVYPDFMLSCYRLRLL